MAKIEDGIGRGYLVAIDSTNRIETHSAVVEEDRLAADEGDSFQISSATVSFTAATESAILYIKNTSSKSLIIDRVRIHLGTVTGGTGDWTYTTARNPSAGTLVSTATAAGVTNVNHGSSKEPTGFFYRGVQGSTLTDGTNTSIPIKSSGDGNINMPVTRVLPTGASMGFKLTPPTGTTAAAAHIIARVYYPTAEG